LLVSPLRDWLRRPGGFLVEFSGDACHPPDDGDYDFVLDSEEQVGDLLKTADVRWISEQDDIRQILNKYFPGRIVI